MGEKRLKVYTPQPRFPPLSLSGAGCELHCKHCTASYLAGMMPVTTPADLLRVGRRLALRDAVGVLLSGGSARDGRLLNLQPMVETIRRLKEETGLLLNLHPGLLDDETARALAPAIDFASLELPARETIQEVFGLDATEADYRATYDRLRAVGIPVVPHVAVYAGDEDRLLEGLAPPETVVIIVFVPTRGTPLAAVEPPSPETVAGVIRRVRALFPQAELALGCMRPRSAGLRRALEHAALEAGVTRVAVPARSTLAFARNRGYEVARFDACCALPREHEARARRALPDPL